VRYAQEKKGQKLHLVQEIDPAFNDGHEVSLTALCGKRAGRWRMTINVPMGMSCANCQKSRRRRRSLT
jgi:hypothetical protein